MSEMKLPIIVVCSEGGKTSQEIIDSKFYGSTDLYSIYSSKNWWLKKKKISLKICGKKQQTKTQSIWAMDLLVLNFIMSRNTMKMILFSYHTNRSTLIWCPSNCWTMWKELLFTLTQITYDFWLLQAIHSNIMLIVFFLLLQITERFLVKVADLC